MTRNRTRLLLTIGIGITFVVLVLLFYFSLTAPNKKIVTISPPPVEKITISGIPINNIYVSPAQLDTKRGDVLFVRNDKYQISFYPDGNIFLITILLSPFEKNRQEAETGFLKKVGVTKEEACRLNVTVGTPAFANPDYSGRKYPLSFCQQKQ